jgi:cellulose synthase/poly-beta-1,6-N-acetylglucosamine synthase-like glycosyltransferase
MTSLLISIFLLYIILVTALIFGWNTAVKRNRIRAPSKKNQPLISIVVPVRNEGKNIANLIHDLSQQHYSHFEVIIVDDHSVDDTTEIVRHFINRDDRFRVRQSKGIGKKAALTQGIGLAAGSIMVTTDADCRVKKNWICGLRQYFEDEKVQMVFGGVKMEGPTFFGQIQATEFMSLIGSGAATAAWGLPTMCNGANLAFRKSAFDLVNGYEGNFHIPSGDDEFLMKKILHQYPGGVTFAADPQTVVTTSPNTDLRQFIHQRIRWAGKWKLHQSFVSKALALIVFSFQMAIMFLALGMVMQWVSLKAGVLLWLSKVLLEYIFLWKVSRFLEVPWNWRAFLLLQLIYPLYTTFIGLFSNFYSFEWKGRKLKSLMVSTQ